MTLDDFREQTVRVDGKRLTGTRFNRIGHWVSQGEKSQAVEQKVDADKHTHGERGTPDTHPQFGKQSALTFSVLAQARNIDRRKRTHDTSPLKAIAKSVQDRG